MRPFPVPRGAEVLTLLGPLEAVLHGRGEALVPYAEDAAVPALPAPEDDGGPGPEVPEGLALAVGTSGSTGVAKRALLTAANLLASATSTHDVLGGPGAWLLAMPAHHIAGLQVLVRSLVAGYRPAVTDAGPRFTATAFAGAVTRLPPGAGRRYTALVPAQLSRLLEDERGVAALQGFDAVLVGGGPTPPALSSAAAAAGVRLVLTYGMSETAGGCVYDGVALPVSEVHIDNEQHVVVGGSTVAHGYLGDPGLSADAFHTDSDGRRWFRTDDLGRLDGLGRLVIRGRADDLINTGGVKVAPGPVEDALVRYLPGVRDAVVVGAPDPDWGQAVCAALTLVPGVREPTLAEVRAALRGILPDHSLPHRLLVLDGLPERGPGKPDRAALTASFGVRARVDETMAARQGEE